MQCVSDLAKLRDAVWARSNYLRRLVAPIVNPLSEEDRRTLAYAAIELDNLVVVGLRQYTKSSLLRSRTASGVRIKASIMPKSTEEAAAAIFKSVNLAGYIKAKSPVAIREKKEVAFRDPKVAEKVFIDYSASNLPNLSLALALNADVFSELKAFRHFFAHRARNTREAVETFATDLAILNLGSPEQLLLRGRPGTGVRFIDGWIADVENFFDLAA